MPVAPNYLNPELRHARPPERMLLWHCNDLLGGGQTSFPIATRPLLALLALQGTPP